MSDITRPPPPAADPLDVDCPECGRIRKLACRPGYAFPFCDSRVWRANIAQTVALSVENAWRNLPVGDDVSRALLRELYVQGYADAIEDVLDLVRGIDEKTVRVG